MTRQLNQTETVGRRSPDQPSSGESRTIGEGPTGRGYLGDLYVMQNEYGLIKIGRSRDPEGRRRVLQSRERCMIELVHICNGEGHREEDIHIALEAHRLEGEWFEGTSAARAAIEDEFAIAGGMAWPFEMKGVEADEWLQDFSYMQHARRLVRKFDNILKVIRTNIYPEFTNSSIWHAHCISAHGIDGYVHNRTVNGKRVTWGQRRGSKEFELVLPFSENIEAALTLWPDEARPSAWSGTALECSIAALLEHKQRMLERLF